MPADFTPLVVRIREIAAGGGSGRVVSTASRPRAYAAGAAQEAARSIVSPGIEVILDDRVPVARQPSETARAKFIDLGITIRIEWPVPFELLDSARDLMRAAAASYEEELRWALQWPGNLRAIATATTRADGVVLPIGTLTYVRGASLDRYLGAKIEREDFPARRFSILSRFRCFVDAPQ